MGIPIGTSYTTTLSGGVAKHVCCEHCRCEFVYRMDREAVGESTSWLFLDNDGAKSTASTEAANQLAKMLDAECDPVPCPQCYCYQKDMQTMLKGDHRAWMFFVACFLFVVCFFSSLVLVANLLSVYEADTAIRVSSLIAGGSLFVGIALIVYRRILAAQYEPNLDPLEDRQQIAQARAVTREEYERLAEQAQEEAKNSPKNNDPRWSFLGE